MTKPTRSDATNPHKPVAIAQPAYQWVLVSLSLPMLMSSLGVSSANVALPTLAQAFQVSFQAVQWVVLAYLLAITSLIVGVGRLGDIMGRRRLLLAGIWVFTLASVGCGVSSTFWMLIAARALQGLGAAVLMALTLALVAEVVPKNKTGSAMGLLGTMSAVGTALGPTLGGGLIATLGWQAIFWVNLPLGLLTFLFALRYLPPERPRTKAVWASLDGLGTGVLALTLAAYALAMTVGRGNFGLINLALLVTAMLGVAVFMWIESKATSPLIRWAMFGDRVLSAGFVMSTLVTTVVMATLVVGPFYLSGALHLDAARVGLVMSVGPLVAALTGLPAGHLTDRFGPARMSMIGLVAMVFGCAIMTLLPTNFGIAGYALPLVVITAGFALFQAANNTAVMSDVRVDQRGVVSGLLGLSRNLGLVTGASVMGAVFAFGSASADVATASAQAVVAGMRATFVVAAVLIGVALAIALLSRIRTKHPLQTQGLP